MTQVSALPDFGQPQVISFQEAEYRFWKIGKGKPILFLHNAGTSSAIWSSQVAHFSREYTCYLIDLPGYGASVQGERKFSLHFYTQFLDHFLAQNQISSAILVGNCLGSAISLQYAIQNPDKIEGLLLFHLLTRAIAREGMLKTLFILTERISAFRKFLGENLASFTLPNGLGRLAIKFQLGGRAEVGPVLQELLIRQITQKGILAALANILVSIDSFQLLDQFKVTGTFPKTLFVWGTKNRILPYSAGIKYFKNSGFNQFESFEFRSVKGGGHLVMCEMGEECNLVIAKFLSDLRDGPLRINSSTQSLGGIEFRRAHPDDVDQVVPLIYESSQALLDFSFGFQNSKVTEFLALDFQKGTGLFGYLNQFVAVTRSGEIIATITAYEGRNAGRLMIPSVVSAWKHFGWIGFFSVLQRIIATAKLFKRPRTDGIFFANACVASNYRSQGVFSFLFKYAAHTLSHPGIQVLELDVSLSNLRAQKLYDRLGFRLVKETPYYGNKSLEGFRRMERDWNS
jgi:pimeloyl-ACP methyl ester carboxylesterase/ribosomal protein S18 acetylase RimI-like enzyme